MSEVLTNSIEQMLIESPPLQARHGKGLVALTALLTHFECGQAHGCQTRITMTVERRL